MPTPRGHVVPVLTDVTGLERDLPGLPAGAVPHLDCFYETTGTFTVAGPDSLPSELSFVRVDDVVERASTPH